jgi:signal transduction histidine kinase
MGVLQTYAQNFSSNLQLTTSPMDQDILLETLLLALNNGVVVCDPGGTILFFNRGAEDLFARSPLFGTGKSLYALCSRPPVEQALNLLRYQQIRKHPSGSLPYVQFLNTSIVQEQFFRCRTSLLPSQTGQENDFVIIFEDITAWHHPDNPLLMKIEEFRAPMTNLRAAVENLTEYPEMSPVMRSAFENVLVQESLNLTEAFTSLARSCRTIMQTQNHLTEIDTELLFGYVKSHLQSQNITAATSPKQGIGARVDLHGLVLVLDYLAGKIQQFHAGPGLSCKIHIAGQFIYFDFVWPGALIPTADVAKILRKKLASSIGEMTVASILRSMDGDIWSQQHENSSTLRLALPVANQDAQTT